MYDKCFQEIYHYANERYFGLWLVFCFGNGYLSFFRLLINWFSIDYRIELCGAVLYYGNALSLVWSLCRYDNVTLRRVFVDLLCHVGNTQDPRQGVVHLTLSPCSDWTARIRTESLRFILLQSSPLWRPFVEQCLLSAWLWILVHFLPWLASWINKGIKPYYSYLKCYTSVYWNYSHWAKKKKKDVYIVLFSDNCCLFLVLSVGSFPLLFTSFHRFIFKNMDYELLRVLTNQLYW